MREHDPSTQAAAAALLGLPTALVDTPGVRQALDQLRHHAGVVFAERPPEKSNGG